MKKRFREFIEDFATTYDEENKRRFKKLVIFDYGELRITDFY